MQSMAAVAVALAGNLSLPKLRAAICGRHFAKDDEGITTLPAGDWDSVTVKRGELLIPPGPGHIKRLNVIGGKILFGDAPKTFVV